MTNLIPTPYPEHVLTADLLDAIELLEWANGSADMIAMAIGDLRFTLERLSARTWSPCSDPPHRAIVSPTL